MSNANQTESNENVDFVLSNESIEIPVPHYTESILRDFQENFNKFQTFFYVFLRLTTCMH